MNKWKRFMKGLDELTPEQLLHAKMTMHIGAIVGLIFASITLVLYETWYFTLFMIFVIGLQVIEFIKTRQQWKQMCERSELISLNKAELMKITEVRK